MRLPGNHEVADIQDYTGKRFITYAGWSSKFSKDIPLPMQRAIIEPYCQKNKISYTSYEFENDHMNWQPGLEFYIKERPDGIVLCSMYSLTDEVDRRNELLELALDQGVELHFANELTALKSKKDLDKIRSLCMGIDYNCH
jgi:sporadic carbohydrate cluster protein (TIGR04323 family)